MLELISIRTINGVGQVITDFGKDEELRGDDHIADILIQVDGKIIATGISR